MPGSNNRLLTAVPVQDGVVKVSREWLKDQAVQNLQASSSLDNNEKDEPTRNDTVTGIGIPRENWDMDILWVDRDKTAGLKLRVKETEVHQDGIPDLVHRDEGEGLEEGYFVGYEVEIQGMYFFFFFLGGGNVNVYANIVYSI